MAVSKQTVESVVKASTKAIEVAVDNGRQAVKAGADAATKSYEEAVALSQENAEKASSAAFKSYDEFGTESQAFVSGLVQSNAAFAKNVQSIGSEMFACAQDLFALNLESAKTLASAKSPQDVFEAQSKLLRKSVDRAVANGRTISELWLRAANEAGQPFKAQADTTLRRLSSGNF